MIKYGPTYSINNKNGAAKLPIIIARGNENTQHLNHPRWKFSQKIKIPPRIPTITPRPKSMHTNAIPKHKQIGNKIIIKNAKILGHPVSSFWIKRRSPSGRHW